MFTCPAIKLSQLKSRPIKGGMQFIISTLNNLYANCYIHRGGNTTIH